ncbi:MAG: Hsp20/alpha crystallin family protein [Paludibacteraceae bacterium]|nr:Hsp20/alpha crystallin family protein [Paludibacteraceae bacterium]
MLPMLRHEQNWLPSLFNDFLSDEWPVVRTGGMTTPAINVEEDEKSYHVEIAAAGMTKDDFKIHVNDRNELVIFMEKKEEQKEERKNRKFLRHEFNYSRFEQSLLLPDDVDKEAISAKMEHGVLSVELPKLEPQVLKQPTRVIDIQ